VENCLPGRTEWSQLQIHALEGVLCLQAAKRVAKMAISVLQSEQVTGMTVQPQSARKY
jgi:hypothetical protein